MPLPTPAGSRLTSRYTVSVFTVLTLFALANSSTTAAELQSKLQELALVPTAADSDWLVEPTARKAGVYRSGRPGELVLDNGLIRRTFLVEPNLACVELRQLQNGESLLRSIRPECQIRIDDQDYDIGGLVGQPLGNFLRSQWYPRLKNDPASFQFTDFSVGPIEERFAWKQRPAWMANDVAWPPKGVEVQFKFNAPFQAKPSPERTLLFEERFGNLSDSWKVMTSDIHPRISFRNEGKVGEVFALENSFAFAERKWLEGARGVECEIDPGTDKSASWGPGLAIVGKRGIVRLNLRPGKAEFGILQNNQESTLPGMTPGKPARLRLLLSEDNKSIQMWVQSQGETWRDVGTVTSPGDLNSVRIGKMSRNGKAVDHADQPSEPQRCRINHFAFLGKAGDTDTAPLSGVSVSVHYEVYDGLPLICKWFTLENNSGHPIHINAFTSEILACAEASSQVEDLATPMYPNLHIETDFTSCSMHGASAQRDSVHWLEDPTYKTQVNYLLQSKCLLECRPPLGPEVSVANEETFQSFRTWILAYDDRNETRQALALCRMYKTISPWVTENPLIHHVRSAHPDAVRLAIDQSSAVGFELVIMTFGSGFNIENEDPAYLAQIRELTDYAHKKGIALGGYSLLASRSVSAKDDVINPETGMPGGFARFGNSPCLESEWGQDYFRKLFKFYEATGCDLLEHDGSYPGDACASDDHPGHAGYQDSRWRQWQTITQFYRWCRGRGVYLNVPDWYFLNGSNKNGMGYRETNWSLPRDYQEIIERQNIHDGTRFKLPSMGWMFVPLTQYHGGGAEATIEPLSEHLDHYERRLQNLLGAGVQACFRGPRIYDTEETKSMVKHWVDFYRKHRSILDSALIPLRRADGRDWDGWLHVNPELKTPALAVVYNPLNEPITRDITIPLYYSGLSENATVSIVGGNKQEITLDRRENAKMTVTIAAQGATWIVFTQ